MQVQQFVNMLLSMMVMAPLTAIGGIVLAVRTDAPLSLVIVVVVPAMGLAIWLLMRQGFALFRSIQKKVDRLNLVLRENLTVVRVVRAFGRVPYEADRFDQANLDLTDTSVRVFQIMATLMPVVFLIMNLAMIAIVWFGADQINAGQLQLGNLMAFIQYVMQIMFAVMMVSMMLFMIPRAQASAVRINEVLDLEPEFRDPESPKASLPGPGTVEFRHVTFYYPGGEEPALQDISFAAKPGQTTAIIGGTGAGKSTLMNLIMRFYEVSDGSILVDGVDIREVRQQDLRQKFGYVPSKAVLFTGSVLENIRYGDPDASTGAAMHAAEIAQAGEFVRDMEAGLDAEISQGGVNLSGGQRQRLAMARALARKTEIYLFDDSFSALDFKTDSLVRAALRRELHGATVMIVAQRVSTVMDADQILVLDDGRLVGAGSHHELMATCDVYREIVSSQLTPEEIA
jgi:ATP-binding cassette subfamily B protein